MKSFIIGVSAAALVAASAAAEIVEFSQECETALALSAAPANMRESSGVYVLGRKGFELIHESENGYYCMVVRENYQGVVPQCFDPESQNGHLKVHIDEAVKMRTGAPVDEIRAAREAGFKSGGYQPAKGHGVVYMASAYNFVLTAAGRKLLVAPHVMYHAPNMTNEDIGASMPEVLTNKGMPFLNSPGPLGFMISFVEKATDTSDVERACAGQLPDTENWEYFPAG